MKNLSLLLLFLSSFFLLPKSFAANVSVRLCTTDTGAVNCPLQPSPTSPVNLLSSSNIITLQFTITNINMNVTIPAPSPGSQPGSTYNPSNWGVQIGSSNSASVVNCTKNTPCDGLLITIPNNAITLTTQGTTSTILNATGTLSVTLDFSKLSSGAGTLPSDIYNILSNANQTGGTVTVAAYYSDPNNGSPINSIGSPAPWQPDTGAMVYAPTASVQAMDSAFVVNFSGPSNTSAVTQIPAPPATPTALVSTSTPNSITGYVIAYWLDSNCAAGGWTFSPNPVSYATTPPIYTCSYTAYSPSFNIGGFSSALGCSATGFLSGLSADTAAIPPLPNGMSDLATLIANPGLEIPAGCMNVTYVASPQSSWTKTGVRDGDIYGVTVWALNAAVTPPFNTPNLSLAHSNINYITSVPFGLASLDKNPDLAKTTDCFVVTAASGRVDSKSVFYWRILRDAYLTPMGITKYYYAHSRPWTAWLEEHPSLKPPLNFFFETSGYALYHTGEFVKKVIHSAKAYLHQLVTKANDLLDQKASAQESESIQTPQPHPPKYDLFITGGILLPTQDKSLYNKYYSSQPTSHFELAGNRIFWFDHFGFSVGGLGRYLANSQNDSVPVLGNYSQSYTRLMYSVTLEALVGLRYLNPSFVYVVPGIFAGVGITRFREQASDSAVPSPTDLGVTQWSGTYEFGGNLDLSLLNLARTDLASPTYWLNDILLRLSCSYNINPTKALSSTGLFVQGGFVFLIQ